jgi:hypothetical protein
MYWTFFDLSCASLSFILYLYATFLTICSVFGFLTGAVVAGAAVYYYILGDYRVTNEMLSDDIGVRLLHAAPCIPLHGS